MNTWTSGLLFPEGPVLMPDGSVLFIGAQRKDGSAVAPVIGPKFVARYQVVAPGTSGVASGWASAWGAWAWQLPQAWLCGEWFMGILAASHRWL